MGYNKKVPKVRIALVQMRAAEDPAENLERALWKVREACRKGSRIVCLGELFKTTYFCQTETKKHFRWAEEIPGPTTETMARLAKKEKIVLIVPVFEKRGRGVYHNTAVVIDADGSFLGLYRKMHIPDDPFYYEKFYFAPGDLGFRTFSTRYGRIAVLICWDQWYPEAARLVALKGAEIVFFPTAIGSLGAKLTRAEQTEKQAWQTIQISHSIANGLYVACVNRVGREKKLNFWGSSFVAGPGGEMLARAPSGKEAVLYADCDLSKIGDVREDWPFLRDRRIDAYRCLTSRFLEPKKPHG